MCFTYHQQLESSGLSALLSWNQEVEMPVEVYALGNEMCQATLGPLCPPFVPWLSAGPTHFAPQLQSMVVTP